MPSYENPLRETPHTFRPLGITGFASPAELWRERSLRLDALFLLHPTTTYFIRAADHALRNLGIEKGDLVIIDRTLEVESGAIVLATLRGAFILRRVRLQGTTTWLESGHPRYPAFAITPEMQYTPWGVALFAVRGLHPFFSLDACMQRYQQKSES